MKILVTGATGFVGREILQQLHSSGHAIRVLARDANSLSAKNAASRCNAEIHAGDVLRPVTLESGMTGIDAVIHLVGIISEVAEQTFEHVHTDGTRNIVTAAKRAGVKRFVQMSALGTRPNAASRYHQTKWAAEELVRASGLDWTIFRPSIIYGPGDLFVNLFANMSRLSPVIPVMGSGQGKLQPVPVRDVARCFVQSLTEPRSIGQTYNVCGRDAFTFHQILDQILEVTDRRRMKLQLPLPLARLMAAALEFLFGKVLHRSPPLNRDQLILLQEDNVGDGRPASELFGLKPVSFRAEIAGYLRKAKRAA